MNNDKTYFSWQAEEFQKTEKSPVWFFTLTAAGLIFFILSLIIRNYLLALIVVIAVFLIHSQSKKDPRLISFEISEKGFSADGRLSDWKEFESFWIFESRSPILLSLNFKKTWRPKLTIPLKNSQDAEEIKNILKKFLPPVEEKESLLDIFGEKLGF